MTPPDESIPSGRATERGNAAPSSEVGAMFDRIAGVYDPMNLAISAFQEPRWRRRAVRLTRTSPGDRVLDVATGTGKVAADLHRRVQPGGTVLGGDLSPGMIAEAAGTSITSSKVNACRISIGASFPMAAEYTQPAAEKTIGADLAQESAA